jgi:hypothetical protein
VRFYGTTAYLQLPDGVSADEVEESVVTAFRDSVRSAASGVTDNFWLANDKTFHVALGAAAKSCPSKYAGRFVTSQQITTEEKSRTKKQGPSIGVCMWDKQGLPYEEVCCLLQEFLEEFNDPMRFDPPEEITVREWRSSLRRADRMQFIEDEYELLTELGLVGRHERVIQSISEGIIRKVRNKKELSRCGEDLLCGEDLQDELDRVFQGAATKNTARVQSFGHPVHYMVCSDDTESRAQILKILMEALYQNGRIQSARYLKMDIDKETLSRAVSVSSRNAKDDIEEALELVFSMAQGGVLALRVGEDCFRESEYAYFGAGVLPVICRLMRKYRHKVLTIVLMPNIHENIRSLFFEQLGALTVVPIHQVGVGVDRARAFLRRRARELDIVPNRALYRGLIEGHTYNAKELTGLFDEWYDKRLKNDVFTQYAEVLPAQKKLIKRDAKGNAFEELQRLIGLCEAKETIRQILDFHTAQKLFREKGFAGERPAMHMVFTGNPGTAKTTVARLVARAMKDNGLLDEGKLHEVGRGDLVGKYVGHTAPLVQQHFKVAKGSVLFIDEAYSLVDDRDGMYGDEAINTIVQEMENHREDTVVIFAGYPDKMQGFLDKNPGLRSRIAFHVHFDDYDENELYQILELMVTDRKQCLGEGVREHVLPLLAQARVAPGFGNGRFVRNLVEQATLRQSTRLLARNAEDILPQDVLTLLPDDFRLPAELRKNTAAAGLGFVR